MVCLIGPNISQYCQPEPYRVIAEIHSHMTNFTTCGNHAYFHLFLLSYWQPHQRSSQTAVLTSSCKDDFSFWQASDSVDQSQFHPTITVEYCLRISLFDFTEHRLTQPRRSILRMIPPVSSCQCSLMLTKRHPMLLETQAYKARPYVCLSLNEEQLER